MGWGSESCARPVLPAAPLYGPISGRKLPPRSQRQREKHEQTPREGEGGWKTPLKVPETIPESSPQPSAPRAGWGALGALPAGEGGCAGNKLGGKKDASTPRRTRGGGTGCTLLPSGPLNAAPGGLSPLSPEQAQVRPWAGHKIRAPEPSPAAGFGAAPPPRAPQPLLPSSTPRGLRGASRYPRSGAVQQGRGQSCSLRSRDAPGRSGFVPVQVLLPLGPDENRGTGKFPGPSPSPSPPGAG